MIAIVLCVFFPLERRFRMDWRIGRTYEAVLPDPVFARAEMVSDGAAAS
jgi:hypothetical protein